MSIPSKNRYRLKKPEPKVEPEPTPAPAAPATGTSAPAAAPSAPVQAPVATAGAKTATSAGPAGLPTGSIDDSDIRPLKMDQPKYPDVLRRRGLSGEVKVLFTVTADGRITDVEILESSNKMFERSVLDALSSWRFAPRVSGGQIVPRKATKVFIFKLQRR
ncbi:TonB family protein [Pseudomonas asuensis]